jgi:hypothetical protein
MALGGVIVPSQKFGDWTSKIIWIKENFHKRNMDDSYKLLKSKCLEYKAKEKVSKGSFINNSQMNC